MDNELPSELYVAPEHAHHFNLINQLDTERIDLMDPIDILILMETAHERSVAN